jgi:hypothetical protein
MPGNLGSGTGVVETLLGVIAGLVAEEAGTFAGDDSLGNSANVFSCEETC